MKHRLPILLVLAAALVGGYYFYLRPRWTSRPADAHILKLSGNIETHESVIGFKVQGRINELPVEEGQWVEAGTLLARLDSDDYRQQVAMDEANVGVQRTQLALGLAGTRRQQLRVAERVLDDAKADLVQKQIDFKRADALYREGVGPQDTRDQTETNLKRAQATFERARQEYDQAQEGTRREELAVSRATLVQAQQKLRLSKINLEYTTLRAPTSGVVLVRQSELGEVVAPNTPVVTLGNLNEVWLRAYVGETDLGRIHFGQEAEIRTDTYPGKTYRGRISFISDKAEFTPKSVQTFKERVTLVYRIKIEVENPNHDLKPGMPADAVIPLNASSTSTQ